MQTSTLTGLSALASLESLTEIGLRRGMDMRPTLLRVLTDLYVQKPRHTPEEERHYTELALRLLDAADLATRVAVATRLANHLSPPAPVIERLSRDVPDVAGMLRTAPPLSPDQPAVEPQRDENTQPRAEPLAEPEPAAATPAPEFSGAELAPESDPILPNVAHELNELFFAAEPEERRLILLNLDIAAPLPAGNGRITREAWVAQQLEAAALARKREDFSRALARSLGISREQAQRIARDPSGEPLVIAAKALNIPRDLLYRILLFVNTAIGHSVERVHALATLYDEVSVETAEHFIAIWQALNQTERATAPYRPLLAPGGKSPHAPLAARRVPAAEGMLKRRDAS